MPRQGGRPLSPRLVRVDTEDLGKLGHSDVTGAGESEARLSGPGTYGVGGTEGLGRKECVPVTVSTDQPVSDTSAEGVTLGAVDGHVGVLLEATRVPAKSRPPARVSPSTSRHPPVGPVPRPTSPGREGLRDRGTVDETSYPSRTVTSVTVCTEIHSGTDGKTSGRRRSERTHRTRGWLCRRLHWTVDGTRTESTRRRTLSWSDWRDILRG